MIKIYTDSTSYIPDELVAKYQITILPLSVTIGGKNYLETKITNEHFFELVDSTPEFPKSSLPATDDMKKAIEADVAAGHTIVGVFISSLMSGTYSAFNLVRSMIIEQYPDANIHLIDSRANCMQLGLAALAGAMAAANGDSIEKTKKAIHETMLRTRFIFVPYTLSYLEKGGRIGKASALLGNALHLIPILTVIDGETTTMTKVRTYKKATAKLVSILAQDIKTLGIKKIIVAHINTLNQAKKVIEQIQQVAKIPVEISHIGPVIGAHVGPGSLGIIYETKKAHPLNSALLS